MPVQKQKFITRNDIRAHPDRRYLFGDNQQRVGTGGQARNMRGEWNSVGVCTKRTPGTDPNAYWSDDQYEENLKQIETDLFEVEEFLLNGGTVVVPEDGLGTGLSLMAEKCPRTFEYLQKRMAELETIKPPTAPKPA